MKKVELKSRKLLRKIFNGFSLTAVAFIFQACYGPCPGDCDSSYDVKISGIVTSETTNLPIKRIKVFVDEGVSYGFTNDDGKFNFYARVSGSVDVHFRDIDGIENGHFADSTIIINPVRKDEVRINMALREIQ